jgi:UDP-glucosyl transferase 73C
MLMDEGEGGEGRRNSARELGEMAKRAVEYGGSSHIDMTLLIQDICCKQAVENQPNYKLI